MDSDKLPNANASPANSSQANSPNAHSPKPHPAKPNHRKRRARFIRKIAAQESRKLRARQEKQQSLWFGLGLLGLVGWSIVVPTLLGLALGVWIDGRFPSRFSWTLMLMVAGLGVGCLNAWQWVDREQATLARRPPPPPPIENPPSINGESDHE